MHHRIFSSILLAFFIVVCSPDVMKGQSIDSLLYLADNDLVEDDADKYDLLCQVISLLNDAESKIRYSDLAIEQAKKLDILPALPYLIKGEVYLDSGKLALALECFFQAANYSRETGNGAYLGRAYMSMAEAYNMQGNPDNEKLYLQNAIKIFELEKDSFLLGYALHNLGYHNYSKGLYDTALVVYTESLELFRKLTDPYASYAYFTCLGNLGLAYSRLPDFDKAGEFLLTAIDTLASLGGERAVTEFMIGYANVLRQKGEIKHAISYASRAMKNTDSRDFERDAARLLATLYANSGRYDSAYYYQSIFIVANDSIRNIESVQKMADLRTEFEVGKKQAEVDVLQKTKQINTIIIFGLGIILFLAIGLVRMYHNNLKRSRKLNDEINAQKEEIETQRDRLFAQNEDITDSINYAERIQSALLPPDHYVQELLDEVFILFKPRDIVSGDFYWIKQVNHHIIIVAADCTGHGVRGAFMSMLGISYMNEIVQKREILQANQVLNEMRLQVKRSLRQHGHPDEPKDGMDMALCVIDTKTRVMQYAGANNSLYLVQESNGLPELKEIKADAMPLGYYSGKDKPFTNHSISLETGDTFYIFSDGFINQTGGERGKRLMSNKFKELLLEINDQSMYEQKELLDRKLMQWMGDNPQMDDILVIGVRV